MIWICSKQIFIQKITQSLCRSQCKFCPFLPLLPFVYLLNGPPNKILLVAGIYEPWNSGLYDCPTTMYLLTEWEGRTGKYLARGQDVRTEGQLFCFIFIFLVERGRSGIVRISSRAVRVFRALSLWRSRPSYGTLFRMVFQGNCSRGSASHMIKEIKISCPQSVRGKSASEY